MESHPHPSRSADCVGRDRSRLVVTGRDMPGMDEAWSRTAPRGGWEAFHPASLASARGPRASARG
jgi:hypothetical protein